MTSEITPDGITIARLPDLLASVVDRERAEFGNEIEVEPSDPLGQINGVIMERVASVLELAEAAHDGNHLTGPDADLVWLAALAGLEPYPAVATTVIVVLAGTAATIIPSGSLVRIAGTTRTFRTIVGVTIGGGGTVETTIQAVDTGPVQARAGATWEIVTAVGGWIGLTNALDGITGRPLESSNRLRARLLDTWTGRGNGVDSLLGALLRIIPALTEVRVFENKYAFTDADGRPPHSSEVMVVADPAQDQQILETIFGSQPVGIRAFGLDVNALLPDLVGDLHPVGFSRAADLLIWVEVDVERLTGFPTDGADLIEQAIVDIEPRLRTGRAFEAWLIDDAIADVIDPDTIKRVTVRIGLSASPANDDSIAVGTRRRGALDSTRIAITITPPV